MAATFQVKILSSTRAVFDGESSSLVARGRDGYFGILARHAPLISSLVPGKLVLKDASGTEQVFSMSGGLLEVADNRVVILADAAECPEEIDYDRACEAERRARERLEKQEKGIDVARAEHALRRAFNRKKVAEEYGHAR